MGNVAVIYQVDEIPRALTGKKMELPVRKLLLGAPAQPVLFRPLWAHVCHHGVMPFL
ncbi:hypothetical protein ACFQAT_15505 [Undibacterium arcticum]|uniref:hypothetical protein n=1 Tax=Undibacterium arcticum TaxID=1762892 RepID=UPI00360B185A